MLRRTSLALSIFGTVVAQVLGTARFVRVEHSGSDKIISLNEVQVFAVVDGVKTNVALASGGATATQSSTWWNAQHGDVAVLAIDGSTSPQSSHTLRETNPWWMVDMQSSYRVTKIVVWNRTDGSVYRDYLSGAKVSLLDASGNVEKELSIGDATNLDSFTFTIGRDTRFVKVSVENNMVSLAEVQVFAPADGAGGAETNVALASGGATATESTTWTCNGAAFCPYLPINAIDGVTLTSFEGVTGTNPEAEPWWMVDLQGSFPVRRIVVWNRQDRFTDRLNNATVSLLDASGSVMRELHIGLAQGIVDFTFELGPPVHTWQLSYTPPSGGAVSYPAWYHEPRFQGKYGV